MSVCCHHPRSSKYECSLWHLAYRAAHSQDPLRRVIYRGASGKRCGGRTSHAHPRKCCDSFRGIQRPSFPSHSRSVRPCTDGPWLPHRRYVGNTDVQRPHKQRSTDLANGGAPGRMAASSRPVGEVSHHTDFPDSSWLCPVYGKRRVLLTSGKGLPSNNGLDGRPRCLRNGAATLSEVVPRWGAMESTRMTKHRGRSRHAIAQA